MQTYKSEGVEELSLSLFLFSSFSHNSIHPLYQALIELYHR